jgi:hypothetical protein
MNRSMARVFLFAAVAAAAAAAPACNFGQDSGGSRDAGLLDFANPSPVLVAMPSSEDFGTVSAPAQSASKQILIMNAGEGSTGALAVALSGSGAKDFGLDSDGCTGMILTLDGVCAIGVHFKPQAAGAASATLTVSGNPGGDALVSLSGNGGGPSGSSSLSIAPMAKDLGSIAVGTTSMASVFTVTNTGTAASGAVSLSLTGSDASQFALSANQCGKSLPPSGTCTVDVSAAPTSAGTKAATLVAQSAGDPGMATASLSASALPPAAFAVTPATYDFGPAVQGGPPGAGQTFTVKNTGGVPSQVPSVAVGGANQADFAVSSSTCTSALPALAQCTFVLTFAPTTVGAETAAVTVSATDATSAQATVTGTGLAPSAIAISPTSQDFGSIVQGAAPGSDIPFQVTNTGGVATGTLTASLGGTNKDQFGLGADACTGHTLAPTTSCTVNAHFAPTATGTLGALQASLQVTGTPGGTTAAALTATSIAPAALKITPTAQGLGSVVVGSIGTDFPFQVTNTGGAPTGTISVALGGANKGDFAPGTDGCSGHTLAPSASCTVNAHFAPIAGANPSELGTLTASATPGGNATANLTASALAPASIAFTVASVPFGPVLQQATATPVTLTLKNSGGVASGAVKLTPGGTNPGQFALTNDKCTGVKLAAGGGTCTVDAAFAPSAGTRGGQTATLTASASPGGNAPVTLTGTALAPAALSLSQPTLPEWSNVPVGTTSAAVTFTISNLGDVASTAVSYGFLGKGFGFAAANPCTGPVMPGAPCKFTLNFQPYTAAGATNATLTASATTGGSSTTKLQGTALWVLTVTVQNDPSPNAPCGTLVIGGNVTSAPAGMNCSMVPNATTGAATGTNTCHANFADSTVLTLTESASAFENWAGCTMVPNVPSQCTLTMTANLPVTATWCGPIP